MSGLEIKSVKSPEERRPFKDKGNAAVVNVKGHPVIYGTFEPGWRWSQHVKPIAGTERCEATQDRKSTRLNSSHIQKSRMPSSA